MIHHFRQKRYWTGFLCVVFLYAGTVLAEEEAKDAESEDSDVEPLDSPVTIIKKGDLTIKEYRHGGQLYMVEIIPAKGRPYFVVDGDGDGVLDTRKSDIGPEGSVTRWTIKKFD